MITANYDYLKKDGIMYEYKFYDLEYTIVYERESSRGTSGRDRF